MNDVGKVTIRRRREPVRNPRQEHRTLNFGGHGRIPFTTCHCNAADLKRLGGELAVAGQFDSLALIHSCHPQLEQVRNFSSSPFSMRCGTASYALEGSTPIVPFSQRGRLHGMFFMPFSIACTTRPARLRPVHDSQDSTIVSPSLTPATRPVKPEKAKAGRQRRQMRVRETMSWGATSRRFLPQKDHQNKHNECNQKQMGLEPGYERIHHLVINSPLFFVNSIHSKYSLYLWRFHVNNRS